MLIYFLFVLWILFVSIHSVIWSYPNICISSVLDVLYNHTERKSFAFDSPWLDETFMDLLNVPQWNGSEWILILEHRYVDDLDMDRQRQQTQKNINIWEETKLASSPSQTCSNWLHCHPEWKTSSSSSSSERYAHTHAHTAFQLPKSAFFSQPQC